MGWSGRTGQAGSPPHGFAAGRDRTVYLGTWTAPTGQLFILVCAWIVPASCNTASSNIPPTAERAASPAAMASPLAIVRDAPGELTTAPLTPEPVRVAHLGLPSDGYTYLAIERGYFREQAIEAILTPFDTGTQMIAPLSTDQLDVGRGTISAGLLNAIARGVHLRIVADQARIVEAPNNYALALRPDLARSIRGYEDLRGRPLAYSGEASGNQVILDRALRRGDLTIDDVAASNMTFPDMVPALANEAIDGALLAEPFLTLGERRGALVRWRDAADFALGEPVSVLVYAPMFVRTRPRTAERFMVAYLKGLRDYYAAFFGDKLDQEAVIDILVRYATLRDPSLYREMTPHGVDPNGRVSVARIQAAQEWFLARGQQQAEVHLAGVVDLRYVEAALAQLGPWYD